MAGMQQRLAGLINGCFTVEQVVLSQHDVHEEVVGQEEVWAQEGVLIICDDAIHDETLSSEDSAIAKKSHPLG